MSDVRKNFQCQEKYLRDVKIHKHKDGIAYHYMFVFLFSTPKK